jgi:4-amino-4-deoxy-L-arabinose transferase-like glycosyltransferase
MMQAAKKWLASRLNQWVIFLLVGGLLFRAAIAAWLYPGFDEAYYYLYVLHPDWSYFDHPLLVALSTGLGPWLTGEVSQFTIRIGTLLLYTGALIFLYLASATLFSARVATLTLAIATAIPIFQVGFGVLTVPDTPLMFFWAAALYVAAAEFFRVPESYRPSYRLAIISVLVGLACLGKYHGFILGFGLVGFCLTSDRHRSALLSPWMLLGTGLFAATISPMLWWNWQRDWVSFRFQSNRAVPRDHYDLLALLGTFLLGVAYLFPTFGFPLWWVVLRRTGQQIKQLWRRKAPVDRDLHSKQRFILWMSLPVILGFTLIGGYQQILPTWPMPGFWGATLLLGYQAALWQKQAPRAVQRWLVWSGTTISILMLVALLHVAFGIAQTTSHYAVLGGIWSPKEDTSTQLVDVQQLRQGFANSPTLKAELHKADFVFTNRYFLGGQIAMALEPLEPKPIGCLCEDLRGFAFWSRPDEWVGKNALYITSERFKGKAGLAKYQGYFSSIEKIADVPIRRGGAVVQVFYVYRVNQLLQPYPRPYGNG